MPELPEVETTRRGLEPHLLDQRIDAVLVRHRQLRWPVPPLESLLPGRTVCRVERRAKYLLIGLDQGSLIVHLGMSGSLRIVDRATPPRPHDHVELQLGKRALRLHDPRRFGALLWTDVDPFDHPRLRALGPEPLSSDFSGRVLAAAAAGRRVAIKNLIMDGRVVVGVGNIYATEALFRAGIHPGRPCHRIARVRLDRLADAIKTVLDYAIERGGTTLRDFVNEAGNPGYFAQELMVYGRAGEDCRVCARTIRSRQIGQRASAYCPGCQH
jgi:formamidopyrimidine-DNA glycosylase